MAYRQFTDPAGTEWTAYDVVPRADERRAGNRRQESPESTQEEDRRADDRRITVGGTRPVRLTQGWLCFEKEGERRRLQPIPKDWHLLPDAELASLIEQARVAPQRKTADHHATPRRR